MNKYFEMMLVVMMGLGPIAVVITLMHSYGPLAVGCSLIFGGTYLTLVVLGLSFRKCAIISDLQSNEEQLQDSQGDCPPSYEVVTAKPPPYYLLYANDPGLQEDAMGDVASSPTTDYQPVQVHYHDKNMMRGFTWTKTECEVSPPSYSEAVSPTTGRCVPFFSLPPSVTSPSWPTSGTTSPSSSANENTYPSHPPNENTDPIPPSEPVASIPLSASTTHLPT
ncbi:uncharacterized protein LOC121876240 [Homarus americanus]|uniref:Uncharacterized protein n=1 Tax=Homarus americanus TaxID=6706 RepID=A0A8J5JW58_HOMAM|nr:uncharacterized protein LOC121876240 [Homarus americanus]KAG7160404.1 hypothetical protein Hamer_G001644 [Homarus americanus]